MDSGWPPLFDPSHDRTLKAAQKGGFFCQFCPSQQARASRLTLLNGKCAKAAARELLWLCGSNIIGSAPYRRRPRE